MSHINRNERLAACSDSFLIFVVIFLYRYFDKAESNTVYTFIEFVHLMLCRFAYMEFAERESVELAMALDDSLFRGRQIKVYLTTFDGVLSEVSISLKGKVWVLATALLTWVDLRPTVLNNLRSGSWYWHELMIPWHIMWPSSADNSEQLNPCCSTTDIPLPQTATLGLHPLARKLLISRPTEGRRLSRLAACPGEIRTCDIKVRYSTTRPLAQSLV